MTYLFPLHKEIIWSFLIISVISVIRLISGLNWGLSLTGGARRAFSV
jgi:hypothetical protein